jgi:hypothetical protein
MKKFLNYLKTLWKTLVGEEARRPEGQLDEVDYHDEFDPGQDDYVPAAGDGHLSMDNTETSAFILPHSRRSFATQMFTVSDNLDLQFLPQHGNGIEQRQKRKRYQSINSCEEEQELNRAAPRMRQAASSQAQGHKVNFVYKKTDMILELTPFSLVFDDHEFLRRSLNVGSSSGRSKTRS